MVYAVLFTGRNFVLFAALIAVGVPLILRAFNVKRTALFLGGFVFALFSAYAVILNHGNVSEGSFSEGLRALMDLFAVYTVGPIAAFDTLVRQTHRLDWGINSFRNVVLWLNQAGWHIELRPIVQAFTEVGSSGWQTNIYTVYQPMYLDFGVAGIVCFQVLAGVWHGYLYRRATQINPSGAFVVLYAIFLLPLLMQVEVDYYLTILSQWILFLLIVGFVFAQHRTKTTDAV
jgi:oligosaccharide repeat unit polymerase